MTCPWCLDQILPDDLTRSVGSLTFHDDCYWEAYDFTHDNLTDDNVPEEVD